MAVTPPGLVGATANRPTARNPLTVNGIRPWVAVAARCILLLLRRSEGAREHRPHCDQFGGNSIVVRITFDADSCAQSTSSLRRRRGHRMLTFGSALGRGRRLRGRGQLRTCSAVPDRWGARNGSTTVKLDPRPGPADAAVTSPPWPRAIPRAIVKPIPDPADRRGWPGAR